MFGQYEVQFVSKESILVRQGLNLGTEMEILKSRESKKKLLQKEKDRSLPLKDEP